MLNTLLRKEFCKKATECFLFFSFDLIYKEG